MPTNDAPYTLRLARRGELQGLVRVDRAASERFAEAGLYLAFHEDHPFVVAETARWACAIDAGRVHVAVDAAGQLIGFAALGVVDGAPYLDQLSVRPRATRRGVGQALMDRALAWSGARTLWLTTYAHVPWNRPYFERGGFVVVPEGRCGPELRQILAAQRAALPRPDARIAMARPGRPRHDLGAPRVRSARARDAPFLWRMLTYAASMHGTDADIARARSDPTLRGYVEGFGHRDGDVGVVAVTERGPVGAAWARLAPDGPISEAKVWSRDRPELAIATSPEARGGGVGAALIHALLDAARGRHGSIALSVRDGNAAVRLYERVGFAVERRIVNRVGTTSLVMSRRV